MNYNDFRDKLILQKIFSINDIRKEWSDFNFVNLINWQNKGYIIKVRNQWYSFKNSLASEYDLFFLANRMKNPSYIGTQSALRFYNWIPESVFSITSVTTKKPTEWNTPVGNFIYQSIRPQLFFGYKAEKINQTFFNISDPEKTIIDLLYLNPKLENILDFEGMRLNQEEINSVLDINKLSNYLKLVASPAVEIRWRTLKKYLQL